MSNNTSNTAFNKNENEIVYSSPSNGSQIVLGKDRKMGAFSGYGSTPFLDVNAIEMVVGRGAKVPKDNRDGDSLVNVTHAEDAAKIYISEKSDPDDYYSFRIGNTGKSIAQSSIVLHADAIRIGARESIKIMTSTAEDGKLSDNTLAKMYGIELIAGGGKATQPMVLGNNLKAYLQDVNSCIIELNSSITTVANMLNSLILDYASHFHSVTTPVAGSPTTIAPTAVQVAISNTQDFIPLVLDLSSNLKAIQKLELDKVLNPLSKEYILSNYNRCN